MATLGTLRLWDETPQISRSFVLETKLNDFGDMYSKKTITGFTLSITENSSASIFNIVLFYRQGIGDEWIVSSTFTGDGSTSSRNIVRNLGSPIVGVKNFQLKLLGTYSDGSFGINDIGVIYRISRDTTADRFDAE